MAYIQKVQRKKGIVYRVFIRPPGLKPITKTFTNIIKTKKTSKIEAFFTQSNATKLRAPTPLI